ncbi:hypothetical protein PCH_Pc13g09590 [Penicillium rubens Wisconsin 54-1255]|uniref:Uncharacterized protein n=1 Tax=Penicillium rubens (strain ATCC 28089 / DSM 1075 / NRRL 1951 / Wisconsin 54-1255) TaxID=500485 RepID=B6H441_PENRW|nr:hypothetical protein PCH_Pc13g09590 [Penicillium rubens Wisconsin 54-1255]
MFNNYRCKDKSTKESMFASLIRGVSKEGWSSIQGFPVPRRGISPNPKNAVKMMTQLMAREGLSCHWNSRYLDLQICTEHNMYAKGETGKDSICVVSDRATVYLLRIHGTDGFGRVLGITPDLNAKGQPPCGRRSLYSVD